MITTKFTFLSRTHKSEKEHLYIIIAVIDNDTKALFVNITTEKEDYDTSCILRVGDHEFITHDSVINYGEATITEIDKLEEAISKGRLKPHRPVTDNLLIRIVNGAKTSDAFPEGLLKHLP